MDPIPPHIHALIFDCDGTLADTMPLHWQAWQVVAHRHRFEFTQDRFYALAGTPSRHILATLGQEQGLVLDHLELSQEKEREYLPLIAQVAPVHPVVEIARANRGRLPIAVASSGTRRVITQVLDHLGIRSWFDAVVCSEDVQRHKPAPDIFLEAARRLGVAPQHCRAYEDGDLGMEAIRAAGMEAVDVRLLLAVKPQ